MWRQYEYQYECQYLLGNRRCTYSPVRSQQFLYLVGPVVHQLSAELFVATGEEQEHSRQLPGEQFLATEETEEREHSQR